MKSRRTTEQPKGAVGGSTYLVECGVSVSDVARAVKGGLA